MDSPVPTQNVPSSSPRSGLGSSDNEDHLAMGNIVICVAFLDCFDFKHLNKWGRYASNVQSPIDHGI